MNPLDVTNVLAALKDAFASIDFAPRSLIKKANAENEQTCLVLAPDKLVEVMTFLKTDERCKFSQLCDLTCVDYLDFPDAADRFGVMYSLLSIELGHRIWAKCFVNDPNPEVPSVTGVWRGANWLEREVWDLFGIKFTGHPDLRRIVTWEGFVAHPLRKDYPLRGMGEREDYSTLTRDSA